MVFKYIKDRVLCLRKMARAAINDVTDTSRLMDLHYAIEDLVEEMEEEENES